jgi:UDP-glucose 4-epimerase
LQKILVTGHNSFVGHHLLPFLYAQGHHVFGIGRPAKLSNDLTHLNSLEREKLGDLSDESFYLNLKWKPDIIINLAASTGRAITTLEDMKLSNIKAVKNLLNFATKSDCHTLIHFSTISIHGNVPEQVVSHTTGIYSSDFYGETKLESELILQNSPSDLGIYSLRLPAILAKGAVNHWPSRILEDLLRNNNVLVDNPESKFNNVVYVEDIFRLVSNLIKTATPGFSAFPIASRTPLSIKEIVDEIHKITNSKSIIEYRYKSRPTFVVDDTYARTKHNYKSMSTIDAVSKYVRECCNDYTS